MKTFIRSRLCLRSTRMSPSFVMKARISLCLGPHCTNLIDHRLERTGTRRIMGKMCSKISSDEEEVWVSNPHWLVQSIFLSLFVSLCLLCSSVSSRHFLSLTFCTFL